MKQLTLQKQLKSALGVALLATGWSTTPYAQTQLGADIDGETAEDRSGESVSLDGNRLAIGARFNDGNGTDAGHVRIYEWSGTAWGQLGADIDGEATGDNSGESVSLDGNRLAIGAPQNDGLNSDSTNTGHARVYEWSGSTWVQLGVDIDGEAAHDNSGWSVSLDGNRLAIGATFNDGNGTDAGHVRIYEWSGTAWGQLGTDIDGEAAGDHSGESISLDGNRLAIGARFNDGNGADAGHVRVYEWSGTAWVQLGTDIDGEAAGDNSGHSVSLDGNRLAIGAFFNDGNDIDAGHVQVYEWSGTAWVQLGADIDGEAARDYFGTRLSLQGNRLAIGGDWNDGNDTDAGHVQVYEWSGTAWVQLGTDIDGEAAEDKSGYDVSLDGNRVAIGARLNSGNGNLSGHVRVYDFCTGGLDTAIVSSGDSLYSNETDTSTRYQWIDCANANSPVSGATSRVFKPTSNGTYALVLRRNLCLADTSACINFVSPTCTTPITSTDVQTACDSLVWIDGITYKKDTTGATHTLTAANGCDSIVTLNLTITSSVTSTDVQTACDSLVWIDGITYKKDTTGATHTLEAANGCDSIVTLDLTITSSVTSTDVQTACDSLVWIDGNTYKKDTTGATHILEAANGCDSIVTLALTITDTVRVTDSIVTCGSYTWPRNGMTYTSSTSTPTDTASGVNACDTVHTLDLTINSLDTAVTISGDSLMVASTAGAAYQWLKCGDNGKEAVQSATDTIFKPSQNGDYAVAIASGTCQDTSSCKTITTVGLLENNFAHTLRVYPNPTEGDITIDLGARQATVALTLTDASGKQVGSATYTNAQKVAYTVLQPAGVYFMTLTAADQRAVIRLVKE